MTSPAHRTPARLLRFALRSGDSELAELILRALVRTSGAAGSPLATLTFDRLARAIGID